MSVGEVTARIQQIQAQLGQLSSPAAAPATGPATAPVGVAGGFSAALSAANATAATSATGATSVSPTMPSSSPAGTTAGQAIVAEAKRYLGVPYVWGGTDPKTGLDCSGLVQLVYRNNGIDLPRVSYEQAKAGREVPSLAQARPGDILAFDQPVDHVAIYLGDHKMIEAPRTGLDVRITDVYETPSTIRRVLPDAPAARLAPVGVNGLGGLPAATPYAGLFATAGARYGVSPTLLAAVAKQESGFDPSAVSGAGARGLMQLMPATAAGLGVTDPMNPTQAVDGAARLLRDLTREFGRTDLALAAYNAGPGAVHRYHGIPPYPETQAYVPAVLAHQALLERR